MSVLGFKARVDPLLAFTSGAIPAELLTASMAAGCIPYMHVAEIGCPHPNGGPPAQ